MRTWTAILLATASMYCYDPSIRIVNVWNSCNSASDCAGHQHVRVSSRLEVHVKLSWLAELLQSELQVDPGQEDIASEIQKRLQRVKQIACLTKPQRSASRQLSASSSHRYVAHPESPIHEKGRNAPCVSTSTSAHTTIPTYSGPQHMQEGRPPSHEYSTIPQSFTFYHPQPQQHLSGRHGHSKPRCSNLKPSWDSSFAAEQEDGYVSNVRNRKLLHDHSTSSLQHRQSRRMHALTAAASPGRRPSASHNGIPSLQPGAPHVTAGSHAAFQRVLHRREQRAERRRNTVAAPSQHATPQARQPPRQRRTVHSTGAVHVATVTSAVHPAAGRKAEPRARTRFASVPAAASGRVHVAAVNSVKREGHGSAQALVSGRQANDRASCAAAVSAGNGSCGGSSSTSASKLYPDERQSGGMHHSTSKSSIIQQCCITWMVLHSSAYLPAWGGSVPCVAFARHGHVWVCPHPPHVFRAYVPSTRQSWTSTTGRALDDDTFWVDGWCDCLTLVMCIDLSVIFDFHHKLFVCTCRSRCNMARRTRSCPRRAGRSCPCSTSHTIPEALLQALPPGPAPVLCTAIRAERPRRGRPCGAGRPELGGRP